VLFIQRHANIGNQKRHLPFGLIEVVYCGRGFVFSRAIIDDGDTPIRKPADERAAFFAETLASIEPYVIHFLNLRPPIPSINYTQPTVAVPYAAAKERRHFGHYRADNPLFRAQFHGNIL